MDPRFEFAKAVPLAFKAPYFPEEIKEVSSDFTEIYGQAAAAESYGLWEIAGMGYRKALEFLIKDYCMKEKPDEKDQIKKAGLADCIKTYVDNANVKDCATRAAWLGNDETHYVRKWGDKDIKDLKRLIDLTEAWIKIEVSTRRYKEDMP